MTAVVQSCYILPNLLDGANINLACLLIFREVKVIGVPGGGGAGLGPWPPPWQNYLAWQNRNGWLGRNEIDSLAEKKKRKSLKVQKQNMASIPLFLHILAIFLPILSVFSPFVWFLPYICPFFFHFCPFSSHYLAIFSPILRLAEQFDTKEWYNSLAEQNWKIWPPPERIVFGRTGLSFGRKKLLAPPKKCPRNAYGEGNSLGKSSVRLY